MTLQQKLDAFKADFKAGKPPYNVPPEIHPIMERATRELIASGLAQRALKAGAGRSFYAEVNSDYTQRPEPSDMIPSLQTAKLAAAA